MEESLNAIRDRVDEDVVNYFNINRGNMIDGALRALKRKKFNERGRISVKFADDIGQSEGAIDAGGPTREFLRLAMSNVINSCSFEGTEYKKYIAKCKRGE